MTWGRRPVSDLRARATRHAARLMAFGLVLCALLPASPVAALQPIVVSPDQERVEITTLGDLYEGRGDSLQVETAPGADGAVARMSVRAATPGTNPNWIVFALSNPTDKPIERWVTAERYSIAGSGAVWPDLDARRIETMTPSVGFVPERIRSDRADVFRITLEPGQTITYVAELSSERFARIFLWKPLEYELKIRDRQLFNGVMLGLTGLLAVFLTSIFVANHKLVFPASALVCWCALGYLLVDFGFFHKLFQLRPEDNAVYRAATEAALAASFVIFLHIFLRLALWHGLIRMLVSVWILAQLALIAVAVIDPRLAATFARLSFVSTGVIGAGFTLVLALRGQDRALSLIPVWILYLVWLFGAGVTVTGRLPGEMAVGGLVAGLVLILLIIGFAVTQYAFRAIEPMYGAAPDELQLRSMAVEGANAAVWEWSSRRDEIKVGQSVEAMLGLAPGELSVKVDDFVKHLHPADRERFRLILWSVQERADGRIRTDFRVRHADNSYHWFEVEATSVPGSDPRSLRCVGLMRDVTDAKRAHERLVYDAVHCNLTGLPNRELLLDRIETSMQRAGAERGIRPTLISVGIDRFKNANASFGLMVGDSLLLTVARRLQRHIGPLDTLARVAGDQFCILLLAEQSSQEIASLAERIRRSLRSPIKIAGQEIVITGSLGIAVFDGQQRTAADLLKESQTALYRAKRGGADRIEVFNPDMRAEGDDLKTLEADLRRALEKNQIRVFYQPISYLPTEELAGFEALVRWEHPKLGVINPVSLMAQGDDSDFMVKLGTHVLQRAVMDAMQWLKELPRSDMQLFVTVNLSHQHVLRQELVQEVRQLLGRGGLPRGALKLEVSESLVMQNPEQAHEIIEWLRGAGADIVLDDFGAGFTSLAYLHRFAADTIKIDRSLIQSSGAADGAGSVIVRSLLALCHEMGRKVIAEGVETAEEAAYLRANGCEFGQGFYFGGPIPEREVLQLLRAIRKSESRLQPRGLFRTKSKTKKATKRAAKADVQPEAAAAVAASAPLMPPPPTPAQGQEPRIGVGAIKTSLPKSSVRPRARTTQVGNGAAAVASAATPPPLPTAPPPLAPLTPNPLLSGNGHDGGVSNARPAAAMPMPPAGPLPPPIPQAALVPEPPIPPPGAVPREPPPIPVQAPILSPVPPPLPDQRVAPPPELPAAAPPPVRPIPLHERRPLPERAAPDFSNLPPSIADSLRRLAGGTPVPAPRAPKVTSE